MKINQGTVMKQVLVLLAALSMIQCSGGKELQQHETMALGWIERHDFMTPAYPKFGQTLDTIHVDERFIELIKELHAGFDFVVVLGTWCSDSKREVPRFLKIADLAAIPPGRVTFYGVDRTKQSADGVTEKYHIERVPTFIVLKDGKEVGRIVEAPANTLEEDMLVILAEAQNK
jgi:thiol-disulfide isomerase/thioredoxin